MVSVIEKEQIVRKYIYTGNPTKHLSCAGFPSTPTMLDGDSWTLVLIFTSRKPGLV